MLVSLQFLVWSEFSALSITYIFELQYQENIAINQHAVIDLM